MAPLRLVPTQRHHWCIQSILLSRQINYDEQLDFSQLQGPITTHCLWQQLPFLLPASIIHTVIPTATERGTYMHSSAVGLIANIHV